MAKIQKALILAAIQRREGTTIMSINQKEEADGSHATGLDYVPYDGYVAELHRGEGILTELQNARYRDEKQEKTTQEELSSDALVAALREALGDLTIQMDKQTVGSIVSPVVFREMGRQLGSKRFAT